MIFKCLQLCGNFQELLLQDFYNLISNIFTFTFEQQQQQIKNIFIIKISKLESTCHLTTNTIK